MGGTGIGRVSVMLNLFLTREDRGVYWGWESPIFVYYNFYFKERGGTFIILKRLLSNIVFVSLSLDIS